MIVPMQNQGRESIYENMSFNPDFPRELKLVTKIFKSRDVFLAICERRLEPSIPTNQKSTYNIATLIRKRNLILETYTGIRTAKSQLITTQRDGIIRPSIVEIKAIPNFGDWVSSDKHSFVLFLV